MKNDKTKDRNEPEIVFSRSVKAGKRIYYIDVKKDRNADLFICMTESKRTAAAELEEAPTFEKHKVFLYKEDFSHFLDSLQDAIGYVKEQLGDIEERKEWPERAQEESKEAPEESTNSEEQPKKRGLFGYFKS